MRQRERRKTTRRPAVLLTAFLTVFAVAGCGGSNMEYAQTDMAMSAEEQDSGDYKETDVLNDNAYLESEAAAAEELPGGGSQQVQDPAAGRKLITTVGLEAETYSFQRLLASVEQKTAALGGYIETMDTYNGSVQYDDSRHADLKIRIPEKKLDEFVESVEGQANITNRTESVEDVTLTYVDLKSHKEALQIEQERLLELLEQAESLEDILTIESRLSEVRYQLESMESQLRTLQDQVDFSTVNLSIIEVKQYSAPAELTAWEQIRTGFAESCRSVGEGLKKFGIGFIVSLPYLFMTAVLAGLLIGLVILIVRHADKKQARKKAKKQQASGQVWLSGASENQKMEYEKDINEILDSSGGRAEQEKKAAEEKTPEDK